MRTNLTRPSLYFERDNNMNTRSFRCVAFLVFFLIGGCASRQAQPPAPRVEIPTLVYESFPNSTFNRNSVITVSALQQDPGNFASTLELALAAKYKVISAIANRVQNTERTTADTKTTEIGTIQTRATHAVRVSYTGIRELDQYYARSFTAQIVRIDSGQIEGVIRLNYHILFSNTANAEFSKIVSLMP